MRDKFYWLVNIHPWDVASSSKWVSPSLFKELEDENDNFLVFTAPAINNSKRLKQVAAVVVAAGASTPFCRTKFPSLDTALISCSGDSF